MANSLAKLWICALALGSSALAAQDGRGTSGDIVLDMQSFEIDNKTNLIHLRAPRIKQGDMVIAADEALATGLDFQAKSEWKLNGHVRISLNSAVVMADSAVFTFDDKQLSRGELGGKATFEDSRPDSKSPVTGGASNVVYDYTTRTLRLTDNAWVHKDEYEMEGCDFVYNLSDGRVTSGSTNCGGFRIRVPKKQGEDTAGAAPPQ